MKTRRLPIIWGLLFGLVAASCNSPTADTCINGVDQEGRGPTVGLGQAVCGPVGSDLQCASRITQSGYCADASPVVIWDKIQWVSLEPQIGTFQDPAVGFLKVLTAGVVEVQYAVAFDKADPVAFSVAPGSTPEQMIKLGVILYANSVSSSSPRLSGVALDVQPDRGPEQTCQTNQNGVCEFWVLSGNVRISATKDGYVSAQITKLVALVNNALPSVTLALTPLPPS
jgi:hypothetical protein